MRLSKTADHDLLFADDYALSGTSEEDMQRKHERLRLRLPISTDKAVVMHQLLLNADYSVPRIHDNDVQLKTVDKFV
ncbi:hypothetical protein SprV_0301340000 [Sparganum proliferum]